MGKDGMAGTGAVAGLSAAGAFLRRLWPVRKPYVPANPQGARIDAHAHLMGDHPDILGILDEFKVRILNVSLVEDPKLIWREEDAPYLALMDAHPGRYAWCTTFDLPRFDDPHYTDRVIEGLDRDFTRGALGCKLYKTINDLAGRDGKPFEVDDPLLEPILGHLERRGWTLLTHVRGVSARDRLIERHRGLRIVEAHMGEMPIWDMAARLKRFPNLAVDISAWGPREVVKRGDRNVREFFLAFRDRIIYGSDQAFYRLPDWGAKRYSMLTDEERAKYGAVEVREMYRSQFRYFEEGGSLKVFEWGWYDAEGLGLPVPVLDRLFWANASVWYPGLARI